MVETMTRKARIPNLAEMTPEEWRMIDAYLATGSFSDAARITGYERRTICRAYWRYQAAIRDTIKTSLRPAQN